jgi:hypothetical protein
VAKARAMRLVLGLAVCAATVAAAPAAALAGSISGTVTDTASDAPIAGIQVCSHVSPFSFEDSCAETSAAGTYTLAGLPAGSYSVHFSGDLHNLDYVNQYFAGKESFPGDLVTIGATEARTGVDAELHAGGLIAGTVTDAVSHGPVAVFPVCAFAPTASGEVGRCARTDASGEYAIKGLPAEEYKVEFLGEGEFNYRTQYWEDSEDYWQFVPVTVTLGATQSGIDAALNRGAEISGTVTEAGTHNPLAGILVSLLSPATEETVRSVDTDAAGHYAFRGRPAGTYVVAFSRPQNAFDGDGFSTQYYRGATSFAAATPLSVTPPNVLTGIDGEVVNEFPPLPPLPPLPPQASADPLATSLPGPARAKPPLRCKKGFHKKKVKGKARCVKTRKGKRR